MKKDIIKKYPEIFDQPGYQYGWPNGWDDLVNQLIENVVAVAPKDFKVLQIKEKFAGLRFYYSNGNETINHLADEAENKSYSICQNCGSEGKRSTSGSGWMRTICEACNEPGTNQIVS